MRLKNFLLLLLSLILLKAKAQDSQLSQPYSNPIILNPAYAGGSDGYAIFTNYRNQWPGLDAYKTSVISADIPIDKISGGIGLSFMNDKYNLINSNNYSLSYACSFKLLENYTVRAGLEGSYIRQSIDWSKFAFGSIIASRNGFFYYRQPIVLNDRVELFDFSSGLLVSGKRMNVGFAIHHLAEPNESFIRGGYSPLSRRYSAHGSLTLNWGKFNVSPHLLYMTQGYFQQFNLGCYINRGLPSVGIIYRHTPESPDAAIASLALRHKYFRIGYSYDFTVSKLGMKTYGAHELFLSGLIPHKRERKKSYPANRPIF